MADIGDLTMSGTERGPPPASSSERKFFPNLKCQARNALLLAAGSMVAAARAVASRGGGPREARIARREIADQNFSAARQFFDIRLPPSEEESLRKTSADGHRRRARAEAEASVTLNCGNYATSRFAKALIRGCTARIHLARYPGYSLSSSPVWLHLHLFVRSAGHSASCHRIPRHSP
jgi:hypothetical protein